MQQLEILLEKVALFCIDALKRIVASNEGKDASSRHDVRGGEQKRSERGTSSAVPPFSNHITKLGSILL
jgi:hypothetical protein